MKAPRGYTHGEAPAELPRALSLKLKPGWRFDPADGQFVSANGERLPVLDQLPKGSEIVPTAPALTKAGPATLSAAERHLARYVQLILPKGMSAQENLPIVKRWD